jgi:hypothetical protein
MKRPIFAWLFSPRARNNMRRIKQPLTSSRRPMWNFSDRFVLLILLSLSAGTMAAFSQVTFGLPAQTQWLDTGVDIPSGQRLAVSAVGQWSNGGAQPRWVGPSGWPDVHLPGALEPSAPLGALVGKIGRRTFLIGESYHPTTSAETGRLYLSMNDVAGSFSDNRGFIQVSISVRPPIRVHEGQPRDTYFIPADQFKALVSLVLADGRVQLSQTSEGRPLDITLPQGGTRTVMSYIAFGPLLSGLGSKDIPIDLPKKEYSPDILGVHTGLGQYFITHSFVFVDRLRFFVNNIHSNFTNDLQVRLMPGEVLLDVKLDAPDPAIRGEGNGYTGAIAVVPIPLGWEDGLCPDIAIKDMRVTVHVAPFVDTSGQIHVKDPTVELVGDLSLSVGDWLAKDIKRSLKDQFQAQLAIELGRDDVKQAFEKALTALVLGGKPNAQVSAFNVDEEGVNVFFK